MQYNNKIPLVIGIGIALLFFIIGRVSAPHSPNTQSGHTEHSTATAKEWTCSMHPEITLSSPGKCPICSMDLIPKQSGTSQNSNSSTLPLTAKELLRLDLASEIVTSGKTESAERTLYGTVETDPSTEKVISSRVSGRIERFYAAVPGKMIRAGEPIAVIYSPELYQLVQEIRLSNGENSSLGELTGSAYERFRLLGFSKKEIQSIVNSPSEGERMTIRADRNGVVVESMAREGMQVMMGESLVKIADVSKPIAVLWANETDFSLVKRGSSVVVQSPSIPGKQVVGTVESIDPLIDPMNRAARVRVSLRGQSPFIPGMSVLGVLQTGSQSAVTIPASAPLITGQRAIVYVEISRSDSGATFEAREVVLGEKVGDRYTVVDGVHPGEKVVVRGAFLLDSELQIRGGKSLLSPLRDTESVPTQEQKSTHEHARSSAKTLPQPEKKARTTIDISDYFSMQSALANDDFSAGVAAWKRFSARAGSLPQAVEKIVSRPTPSTIEELRTQFAAISSAILAERELSLDGGREAFCPMAFGTGASWVQKGDTVMNPYYGKSMLHCGSFKGGPR